MLIRKSKMEETLELLIDRATDQSKNHDTSEHFVAVWDRVNKDTDGPQIAVRYLIQKVRSVNERESLCALELIEVCVRNCGLRFHQEIGKFRFLNELVKLLSTKYDGGWTPPSVKKRIIEMIYSWTKGLPREVKILDAYKMLKTQGVVTVDPVDPYQATYPKECQRPQDTLFSNDEKSKLLARLLKSKHPEDLQAANRLIKTMVRQDEIKTEKKAKRNMDIERCSNNARLLMEMLSYYQPSSPPQDKDLMRELFLSCEKMRPSLFRLASSATEEGDEGLAEILKANDELTKVIDEYRKKVGTETEDTDTTTSEAASEQVSQVPTAQATKDTSASSLIDLGLHPENNSVQNPNSSVLDDELKALGIHDEPQNEISTAMKSQPTPPSISDVASLSWGGAQPQFIAQANSNTGVVRPMANVPYPPGSIGGPVYPGAYPTHQPSGLPLMNQSMNRPVMMIPHLGGAPRPGVSSMQGMRPLQPGMGSVGLMGGMRLQGSSQGTPPANKRGPEALKSPTTSLDILGLDMMQKQQQKQKQSVSPVPQTTTNGNPPQPDTTLLSLATEQTTVNQTEQQPPGWSIPQGKSTGTSSSADNTLLSLETDTADIAATPVTRVSSEPEPLDNVFVPLDSVLPGDHQPLTVLDKKGLKMVFHFAKTTANLNRSDVIIVVISIMSTLNSAVQNFVLQTAVPKTMKVRLQPPSGSNLPPHNPILPAAAITQVMLIANPNKEKIRLKYRATYEVDGSTSVEAGEVDSFPS